MYVQDLVYNTLKDITFNGKLVPVTRLKYTGESKTFITYYLLTETRIDADNETTKDGICYFSVNIFSTSSNMESLVDEVESKMSNVGFCISNGRNDLFETNTEFYHTTIDFSIEKYEI